MPLSLLMAGRSGTSHWIESLYDPSPTGELTNMGRGTLHMER
jgi:hypothetical protein